MGDAIASALLENNRNLFMSRLLGTSHERGQTLFINNIPNYKVLNTDCLGSKKILSAPLQVYYDMTTACNLKCKHCYTSSGVKANNELNIGEISNWAKELSDNGVFKISIGGGEPLSHPEAYNILKLFRDNFISLSLSTNALLLNEEWIEKLNTINLRTLSISMEGGDCNSYEAIRGEGTLKLFVNNALMLKQLYKNRYSIRVTITKQTINHVRDILSFANRIGAYGVKFKYLQHEGRSLDHKNIIPTATENINVVQEALDLSKIFNNLVISVPTMFSIGTVKNAVNRYLPLSSTGKLPFTREFGCGGGQTGLYVSPEGIYSACVSMGKEYFSGNLRDVSLYNAWHLGKGVLKMRNLSCPEECKQCEYIEQCKGGCRARALQLFKDANLIDPYCPFHRGDNLCNGM